MPIFFLTKFALTHGIKAIEGEINPLGRLRYQLPCSKQVYIAQKGEFFDNEEDAKIKAEHMRKLRIKVHHNQLCKLKKMKFH